VFYLCNELQFAIVIRRKEFDIPPLQFILYVLYIWFASNFVIQKLGVTGVNMTRGPVQRT
jgi:hypothetical protein